MADITPTHSQSWEDSSTERHWENTWYFNCLLSLVFYTAGYWLCLQIDLPVWNVYLYSTLGALFIAFTSVIWSWIRLYCIIGIMPTIFHSTLVHPTLLDNQISFSLAPGAIQASLAGCSALIAGLTSVSIPYFMPDTFSLANLVIITSPLVVSILVLGMYREILSLFQTLGICMIVSGLVVKYEYQDLTWSNLAFFIGLGGFVIIITRMLLTKECEEKKLDSHTTAIIILLFKNVLGALTWALLWSFGLCVLSHSLECFVAGVLIGLGDYTFTEGLMKGKVGPASAIISISSILVSGHNSGILQKQSLADQGDLVSLIIIVTGLATLILGDSIYYYALCGAFCRRERRAKTSLSEPLIEESVIIN
jgi:hypothetical protein